VNWPAVRRGARWKSRPGLSARPEKPAQRALLVGINDYPDPQNRLEGCVNDVFLMSSVLQESGFDPDNIRVVLNERATRSAFWKRLDWLLDGAEDGDDRVSSTAVMARGFPLMAPGKRWIIRMNACAL